MPKVASVQTEVDALNAQYEAYVRGLKADWLAQNRVDSKDVWEVMHPSEREKVYQAIDRWVAYITPLAEAWWKERGYGVVWPADDSKPMQVYKLQAA